MTGSRSAQSLAAFGATVTVLASACGGSSPSTATGDTSLKQTVVIRTVSQPLAYFAPMFVAADQGFARQNKLDVQFVALQAGSQDAPAVFNGTLDVTDCTFDVIQNLRDQGKNIMGFYNLMDHVTLDLVVASKVLQGTGVTPTSPLADRYKTLKGRKLGISTPGSPSEIFLRVMLKGAGLDPDKDVTLVRVGSIAGLFAALKSGQIDGYILSPPSPQQAESAGVGTILVRNTRGEDPSIAKLSYVNLCAAQDYIKQNPAVIRAWAKSIQQANDWMRTHPDETVAILSKHFPDVDVNTWKVGFPALLPAISKTGRFNQAAVMQTCQVYKDFGIIQSIPDTKDGVVWTNKYLPS